MLNAVHEPKNLNGEDNVMLDFILDVNEHVVEQYSSLILIATVDLA